MQGRHTRGWLYAGVTIGVGVAAVGTRISHQQTLDDYDDVQAQLREMAPQQAEVTSELRALINEQKNTYDKAKSARALAIATQITLGVLWGLNALDAGLVEPARHRNRVAFEARPTDDGGRVLVHVRF